MPTSLSTPTASPKLASLPATPASPVHDQICSIMDSVGSLQYSGTDMTAELLWDTHKLRNKLEVLGPRSIPGIPDLNQEYALHLDHLLMSLEQLEQHNLQVEQAFRKYRQLRALETSPSQG